MIKLKGKFKWEDSKNCYSCCELPAFGVIEIRAITPVLVCDFKIEDLDKTYYEFQKEYDERCMDFLRV